ncbi:TetR/AcrR family transcriptional regulator [Streptomyces orinoci]|uniref:TetR/AcrR family transcriptional regulator n=1 Tax=Streptomyces orinoci TaxID=67339 RepID=A0ABV3JXU3_STRON|nr:TetR/AcrR family transcriptional regulator [Streptomyces orinoci]
MPADEKQPIPSVWTRPRRRKREQPALSRDQIVAAALELLDTEGIEALSMRRLGTRLNAGATSMYTHVANKDELIELVVDEVHGEIEVPRLDDPAQWRTALARYAHSLRSAILRHPWMASVLGELGVTQLGPNAMRVFEGMLAVTEKAGLPTGEADPAVSGLTAYVIGMSISEAGRLTMLARSGHTEQEWVERLWPAAEEAAREHPQLQEQYAALRGKDPRRIREEKFDYGLQRVLDGLAVRIAP